MCGGPSCQPRSAGQRSRCTDIKLVSDTNWNPHHNNENILLWASFSSCRTLWRLSVLAWSRGWWRPGQRPPSRRPPCRWPPCPLLLRHCEGAATPVSWPRGEVILTASDISRYLDISTQICVRRRVQTWTGDTGTEDTEQRTWPHGLQTQPAGYLDILLECEQWNHINHRYPKIE